MPSNPYTTISTKVGTQNLEALLAQSDVGGAQYGLAQYQLAAQSLTAARSGLVRRSAMKFRDDDDPTDNILAEAREALHNVGGDHTPQRKRPQ